MPLAALPLAALLTLPSMVLAQTVDLLTLADTNGDGAVTRAEVVALRGPVFDHMDADADGSLTPREVEDAQALVEDGQRHRDPWRLDGNGDGLLTRPEFTETLPGFDRADRDGDGVLTPAELDRIKRILAAGGVGP